MNFLNFKGDLNMYSCPKKRPRHMSIVTNGYDWRKNHDILVGGVLIFSIDHYRTINGYSNLFWGWGMKYCDELIHKIILFLLKERIVFKLPLSNSTNL